MVDTDAIPGSDTHLSTSPRVPSAPLMSSLLFSFYMSDLSDLSIYFYSPAPSRGVVLTLAVMPPNDVAGYAQPRHRFLSFSRLLSCDTILLSVFVPPYSTDGVSHLPLLLLMPSDPHFPAFPGPCVHMLPDPLPRTTTHGLPVPLDV